MNDLAFVRGERLVVPWQPHAGNRDRSTSAEVSVRHSKTVQTIMHGARLPIRVGDLLDKLTTEIPGAAVSAIDAMLAELVMRGVLITCLRPPSTSTGGLAHVLEQLEGVQADTVEEVSSLVRELRGIHAQAGRVGWCRAAADGRSPARLHRGITPAGRVRS
ncbi:MAG: lantibiotic dehydratase [Pseudonocardiales bacterium]|nr:lantibiotic dehydratase [Pseudonocardiales bacterium]